MKQLKYYLLFVFFAGVYSVVKIVVFKNEIDRLFVLETLVTSVIVVVVVVFLNNYSETNT
jgi:multisubunit Na+/H+ antiporter MnhF subunit